MKISEMQETASLAAGDVFPIVDGGVNKKAKLSTLKTWLMSYDDIVVGGNFKVSSVSHGYYLVDSTGYAYPGVYNNPDNLWIGSTQRDAKHHTGQTHISSGYNTGTSNGNATIYIDVPNATNTSATSYSVYHSGNKPSKSDVGLGNVQNLNQSKAISAITRSGTTFTYTCLDGTTGTFTQQDNNTTYSNATTSAAGLMSATDKVKLNGLNKTEVDKLPLSTLTVSRVNNNYISANAQGSVNAHKTGNVVIVRLNIEITTAIPKTTGSDYINIYRVTGATPLHSTYTYMPTSTGQLLGVRMDENGYIGIYNYTSNGADGMIRCELIAPCS